MLVFETYKIKKSDFLNSNTCFFTVLLVHVEDTLVGIWLSWSYLYFLHLDILIIENYSDDKNNFGMLHLFAKSTVYSIDTNF